MIDTHSHIYSEEFDKDRDEVIQRAIDIGIKKIILPNIDSTSLARMLNLESKYPDFCFSAIGLHPTSVKNDYKNELDIIKSELERKEYIAIGEIGIDLYWDKSFLKEQIIVFKQQLDWSIQYNLPIIIHIRDAFDETMEVLKEYKNEGLRGVFHSFTGNNEQAKQIIDYGGFYIGINGIVTFKNSGLAETVSNIPLQYILLETDAPYLTPTPYRGKRNESSYIKLILDKLSSILSINKNEIEEITDLNSYKLFKKLLRKT